MSSENQARRTSMDVFFDGADITGDIKPYFLSATYTDNEEDAADDLQIELQDRESLWLQSWMEMAIDAAAAAKLKINMVFRQENWTGGGMDTVLPTGNFEMDSIRTFGPPAIITVKGTSLPFSSDIRQTKKSRAWESYYLSGIVKELAGLAGMTCLYESAQDPFYWRVEQVKTSDINFLSTLCHNAGLSLKVTNGMLVIFEQAAYEARASVLTIRRGRTGGYIKYDLSAGAANTQYASCRVRYVDPGTGRCIEGKAVASGVDAQSNQCLEITAKVSNASEAKALAEKRLRLHNKYTRTVSFTFPGNPALVAGVTVTLEDWGGWSGKYIVKQAKHTLDSKAGYTTQITVRRVLEGY